MLGFIVNLAKLALVPSQGYAPLRGNNQHSQGSALSLPGQAGDDRMRKLRIPGITLPHPGVGSTPQSGCKVTSTVVNISVFFCWECLQPCNPRLQAFLFIYFTSFSYRGSSQGARARSRPFSFSSPSTYYSPRKSRILPPPAPHPSLQPGSMRLEIHCCYHGYQRFQTHAPLSSLLASVSRPRETKGSIYRKPQNRSNTPDPRRDTSFPLSGLWPAQGVHC